MNMHKVFISYHHENDQQYKDWLVDFGQRHKIFIDESVDTGDILDSLSDEQIRTKIRDEYLRDSTVTIVLVGTDTKYRKHVDWEIYSSMHDGTRNKKSGILVINLPTTFDCNYFYVSHSGESENIYPEVDSSILSNTNSRSEIEKLFPSMPARIIDNLICPDAIISVVPWQKVGTNAMNLKFLVDATFRDRSKCNYDLRRPMRRANSSPSSSFVTDYAKLFR